MFVVVVVVVVVTPDQSSVWVWGGWVGVGRSWSVLEGLGLVG